MPVNNSLSPIKLLATIYLGVCAAVGISGCGGSAPAPPAASPVARTVRVVRDTTGFRLHVAGRPYRIRGGGGTQHFDRIRAAGGNSIRLWSTEYAGPLLDEAQRHGLTVMLGLWLEPENRLDYYDRTAVQSQFYRLQQQVLRFRNHPALLMWNVGNELDITKVNPEVYDAVNEIALMIHQLDPNHPVTSSLTYPASAAMLMRRAPAVDILSLNSYAALADLPEAIRQSGWKGPYIVTEFGPMGYWEARKTPWGAPIEQSSKQKAAFAAQRYRQTILRDSARCLGSYVFFWGYKFEKTATWFSLFTEAGEKTLLADSMQYLWQGKRPVNIAPSIDRLRLDGQQATDFPRLRPNSKYTATAIASDPEGQPLSAKWELWPEQAPTASPEATVEPLSGYISQSSTRRATLRTPLKPGAYRLLLTVRDRHGGIATANIPFFCGTEAAAEAALQRR